MNFKNNVIHGDCLEKMESIPPKTIDMILCDLPYGCTSCKWDVIIPFNKLWALYNKIIKDNGCIALFGNEPFSSMLRLSNLKNYKYDLYWQKEKLTNVLQIKRRFAKTIENICIFYKKQCTYNPQKYKSTKKVYNKTVKSMGKLLCQNNIRIKNYIDDGTRFPKDLLIFNRDYNFLHPTQKPVALLEYLIKSFTNENDLVLDNCAGSGSTAIACLNTNRNYLLIEKEKEYIDVIHKRLSDYKN